MVLKFWHCFHFLLQTSRLPIQEFFKLGRHLTLAVNELEIIFFVWILNVDIFHTVLLTIIDNFEKFPNFLTLGDDFVHPFYSNLSCRLSFVHPDHWLGHLF